MGFSEDDRIRSKNTAHIIHDELSGLGYTDTDIVKELTNLIEAFPDDSRNKIRLAVIDIARRSQNGKPGN